ncbi:hypothetical protein AWZ03_013371 [Drosophila navojoa]|uniref:SCP domain-containing protein n=1 Tax=Drosophila navojoa TaxID=7232 RepID=A0A484AU55_DRONA|nr:hypothetical protein AWZ03_013371 [Drosophila navojoa]
MKPLTLQILLIYVAQIFGSILKTPHDSDTDDTDDIEDSREDPYYFHFSSTRTLCPKHMSCMDGKTNFLCRKDPMTPSSECTRFLMIKSTLRSRLKMVHAHNGLRNTIARRYRIANMNLVYWNIHLQQMAEQYLHMCRPYSDTCRIIGENGYEVGHNSVYVERHHVALLYEWEGRAVRHWVMEMLSILPTKQATNDQNKEHWQTLVQVMLPKLEFIGCAGAIMFKGLFVVCYYYPPAKKRLSEQLTFLKRNETCVCPNNRLVCSKLFNRLCGKDIESSATTIEFSALNIILIMYFIWISLTLKKI